MTFTLAQVVLLVLIVGVVLYTLKGRSVSRDRALMLVIAAVGGVLVVWPGLSSDVARWLGVGRGADLVFYLFVLFCLFRFVSIAAERRRTDERLTAVAREVALLTARPAPAGGRGVGGGGQPGGLAPERREGGRAPSG